jgi:hypothetical protein
MLRLERVDRDEAAFTEDMLAERIVGLGIEHIRHCEEPWRVSHAAFERSYQGHVPMTPSPVGRHC